LAQVPAGQSQLPHLPVLDPSFAQVPATIPQFISSFIINFSQHHKTPKLALSIK
jgi:hypothetical protein